ncbi:transcriptional regulator, XRE family [Desulfofarcimen acetoxidans DSM 771]|jgi:DNA-binding XRE family transcriptional regulator|uniref:Transcriptional regulator, XRE family n=2 Tax=Desulfofarcimen acetoxidans TaxID=58138 RepID=C8VW86_DESAS|nr:transcriptional regulator, XRE family [Desulfofarcimen acetoxidans DSM 771]
MVRKMAKLITNLKRYRIQANLSQDELARLVGVRRETIVRLEARRYNPSLKLAYDIARIFNASIEEIFTFTDNW